MASSPINKGGINSGPVNGPPPAYIEASASLSNGHTLTAEGSIVFTPLNPINHTPINKGAIGASVAVPSVNASATLTTTHSLSGDLTLGSELYKNATALLTHTHTLSGDLTFNAVDGSATVTHGHTLSGDGKIVWNASSATPTGHTLQGDLKFYDPQDGSAAMTQTHTLPGDLTLVPYLDESVTMTHGHDLIWTDTQSVYGSATLTQTHNLFGNALGGTPGINLDPLIYAWEAYPDIQLQNPSERTTQYFGLNYNVDGFRYGYSGVNYCELNVPPLNEGCGAYPDPDLAGELNLAYGLGETQASLDMEWHLIFDKDRVPGELGMEYNLDAEVYATAQMDIRWAVYGKTELEDLLTMINAERSNLGLVPYTLYTGAGEDVSTTHSENMADTGIFAHDDGGFPVGYQTSEERLTYIHEQPTTQGENLLAVADAQTRHFSDAATLFTAWWNSPSHKANMLYDWSVSDNPQMLLGYGMRYDWSGAPGVWTTFYTQLFIGFGIPLGATLAQGELNLEYQLDTALITTLNVGYALDAYTPVTQQHEVQYGINVAAQHSADYSAGVAQQHEAPIHYGLLVQHELNYTQTVPVVNQHEMLYDMDQYTGVVQQHETPWTVNITVQHQSGYSALGPVVTQHESGWDLEQYNRVLQSSSNPYGIYFAAQHESVWTLTLDVVTQHEAPYEPTVDVITQNDHEYDILTYNPVIAQNIAYYAMIDSTVTVTTDYATLTVNGVVTDIQEAVIAHSEGDFAYNASIILTDLSRYAAINRGDTAILDIYGETYTLQVESKGLSRNAPAGLSMRIEALSPSIKHSAPLATPIDYENTTNTAARTAVETILGEVVDWQMVNWSIPAYRIRAEDAIPIELAKEIVNAVGGVIEPKRDGTLLVRPAFQVNIPDYATAIVDHTYTDAEHNLSVNEEFDVRDDYNWFHIIEDTSGLNDVLEWVPNDDISTGGILRAYPEPWRTSIQIIHTDGIAVFLAPLGVQQRQETEVVEFVAGSASLSYPGISLDNISWHSTPLTGLALDTHSSTITAGTSVNQGYGVAEITYTVESIEYESNAPLGSIVQYLIEDL